MVGKKIKSPLKNAISEALEEKKGEGKNLGQQFQGRIENNFDYTQTGKRKKKLAMVFSFQPNCTQVVLCKG